MTNQEARAVFDTVIATTTDPDKNARQELLREYFTNADFRKRFEDYSFEHSQIKAQR